MKSSGMLLVFLPVLCIIGCGHKQEDYAQKLSSKIPVGTSQSDAEHVLDQCGFNHSYDPKMHAIYAIRRGEKNILVKQDWSAELKLDEGGRIVSVKVEKVFTGP